MIKMHEMTPLICEIILCTCVDLVVEKEILSVASLHLLSNLYSRQPRSYTSTTLCIVVNSFVLCSVQGLTHVCVLKLCVSVFVPFSATAGHCGEQTVMLCL